MSHIISPCDLTLPPFLEWSPSFLPSPILLFPASNFHCIIFVASLLLLRSCIAEIFNCSVVIYQRFVPFLSRPQLSSSPMSRSSLLFPPPHRHLHRSSLHANHLRIRLPIVSDPLGIPGCLSCRACLLYQHMLLSLWRRRGRSALLAVARVTVVLKSSHRGFVVKFMLQLQKR